MRRLLPLFAFVAAALVAARRRARRATGLPVIAPYPRARFRADEVALGVLADGRQVVWNVAADEHLMVVGHAGAGKSMLLRGAVRHALEHASDWRVTVLDLKRWEWQWLRGMSNVDVVATDAKAAAEVLADLWTEMSRRYALLRSERVADYRRLAERLPAILLVVDEVAMFEAPDWDRTGWSESLDALVRQGPAVGMHVAVSTCLPGTDRLTPVVREACGFRVVFGGASQFAAGAVLGEDAADAALRVPRLPGRALVEVAGARAEFQAFDTPASLP